jgi:hypothetical protein
MEPEWITLRECDEAENAAKGSAFRAFRRIEAQWQEPRDFRVLHHEDDRAAIDALRARQRIYASTVNLLLLSPTLATAVRAQMRRRITDPAE